MTSENMMKPKDYDNPKFDDRWCNEKRTAVSDYLRSQGVKHGRIGDHPAWHIAPCISIWAIESVQHPDSIGWWVFAGDIPTDYISASDVKPPQHPRKALKVIAERWRQFAATWREGHEVEGLNIGSSLSHK